MSRFRCSFMTRPPGPVSLKSMSRCPPPATWYVTVICGRGVASEREWGREGEGACGCRKSQHAGRRRLFKGPEAHLVFCVEVLEEALLCARVEVDGVGASESRREGQQSRRDERPQRGAHGCKAVLSDQQMSGSCQWLRVRERDFNLTPPSRAERFTNRRARRPRPRLLSALHHEPRGARVCGGETKDELSQSSPRCARHHGPLPQVGRHAQATASQLLPAPRAPASAQPRQGLPAETFHRLAPVEATIDHRHHPDEEETAPTRRDQEPAAERDRLPRGRGPPLVLPRPPFRGLQGRHPRRRGKSPPGPRSDRRRVDPTEPAVDRAHRRRVSTCKSSVPMIRHSDPPARQQLHRLHCQPRRGAPPPALVRLPARHRPVPHPPRRTRDRHPLGAPRSAGLRRHLLWRD